MSDTNFVMLEGRLVRDPIIRNNGTPWAFFTVASNNRYPGKEEETAFVLCKCFDGWANALVGHTKGEMVLVRGRLRTEAWGKDDAKEQRLVLVCEYVKVIVPAARTAGQMAGVHVPGNGGPADANGASDPKMPPF